MNETQKNKMQVLEWIDKVTQASPEILKEKVEAAKDLYEFVFGDDVQDVPTEICGYVESNRDNQPETLTFGNSIYARSYYPEAAEKESEVDRDIITCKGSDTRLDYGEPKEDEDWHACTSCGQRVLFNKSFSEHLVCKCRLKEGEKGNNWVIR